MSPSELASRFVARFHRKPAASARAPGRVNLIGEHTDYNDGFVLPIAIEQSIWVAGAPRNDGLMHVFSEAVNDQQSWKLKHGPSRDAPHWTAYVHGVTALLMQRGAAIRGAELFIAGDVPLGGGLSSSAALEVSTALCLAAMSFQDIARAELADLCRTAEQRFAGVPCGIMDQYASLMCRRDHALLLDCRSRALDHVPLKLDQHRLLVVDSGVRHELAAGEYAARRVACENAVKLIQPFLRHAKSLRDVRPADLERPEVRAAFASHRPIDPELGKLLAEKFGEMPPSILGLAVPGAVALACARHVTAEIERTLDAATALRRGDWSWMGKLMLASHASLRDDYQVSCRELDDLVESIMAVPGVLGARMTGGGFGGCMVALLESRAEGAVRGLLQADFPQNRTLWVRPAAAAEVL